MPAKVRLCSTLGHHASQGEVLQYRGPLYVLQVMHVLPVLSGHIIIAVHMFTTCTAGHACSVCAVLPPHHSSGRLAACIGCAAAHCTACPRALYICTSHTASMFVLHVCCMDSSPCPPPPPLPQVTLWDACCKAVYELGSGPYNMVRWSPFDRFLAIAGFGNLPGGWVGAGGWGQACAGGINGFHSKATHWSWCLILV